MTYSINPETLAGLKELDEPGSRDFFVEIANTYLSDTSIRLHGMREAQAAGDARQLAKLAHAIKGSSLNIGADGLASRMQSIERESNTGSVTGAGVLQDAETEFQRVKEELATLLG